MTRRQNPKTPEGAGLTAPYQRTSKEQAVADAYLARTRVKAPTPRMTVSMKDGAATIAPDHPDVGTATLLIMDALGTTSTAFLNGLLSQVGNAASRSGKPNEDNLNFMLSVIKGIEPRDQVEAMLGAQMAAVQMATMTFARKLANTEYLQQQDSAERAFNKLARTFTTQMEALKRYRTSGQQRVVVEHVHVHSGGQAVVGNVSHPGGGGTSKSEDQPHALGHATSATMPSEVEAEREAVPVAGRQG